MELFIIGFIPDIYWIFNARLGQEALEKRNNQLKDVFFHIEKIIPKQSIL